MYSPAIRREIFCITRKTRRSGEGFGATVFLSPNARATGILSRLAEVRMTPSSRSLT